MKKRNQRRVISYDRPHYPVWKNPHVIAQEFKTHPNVVYMTQEYGSTPAKNGNNNQHDGQHIDNKKLGTLEEKLAQMNKKMDE